MDMPITPFASAFSGFSQAQERQAALMMRAAETGDPAAAVAALAVGTQVDIAGAVMRQSLEGEQRLLDILA